MTLLYALLVGIAMGALLQRIRASSPGAITSMLRLEDLTVMKFMIVTIAVGALGVYLLGALGVPLKLDIKPTYVVGVLVGGVIFGVGFGLSGFCPGTCVVGAGEGRRDALFAILGGVVGAGLFTALYRWLAPVLVKPLDFGKVTLADALRVPPLVAAGGLALVFLAAAVLLPTVRPARRR